jgi:anti-sigma factor RsiW
LRQFSPHEDWEPALINCQQLVDFCLDFLDGSLPEEERRMFQDHLGHCGECVTFFRTYERTPEVSRDAFALQMPASVKETVRNYLRARYEVK